MRTSLKSQQLRNLLAELRLHHLAATLPEQLTLVQSQKPPYAEWLLKLLEAEMNARNERKKERQLKKARIPLHHHLDHFDCQATQSLHPAQLQQLRSLEWLEQAFNLILMGPSGTGKTFLAAGLAYDALMAGYPVLFRTMDEISQTIKLRDITRSAHLQYQALLKTQLLILDDWLVFPIDQAIAQPLFHLIDTLHQKASIIITTNKGPKQWAEALGDQVLANAILDRLLFHAEVIHLKGESYRMKNRKGIFQKNEPNPQPLNQL